MRKLPHFREFSNYCMLSVLGTLGVSCYILADTYFVSKGLGTSGLAALNLAIPVYNFIHGTGLMLGMGGATRFSVHTARGEKEKAAAVFTNCLWLGAIFSVLFMALGGFAAEPIASLLGADSATGEMTATYLRWLLLFAPAFILNDLLLCFVRNDAAPRLSMLAMLAGSLANIVLDYIFIFPLKMGIFGAVFATGISPLVGMLMMLRHILGKDCGFRPLRARPSKSAGSRILSLGFPSFVAQASTGLVMMVFNALILGLEGNVGVAAYGVVANISLVVLAVYTGIAQGVQPLISGFYAAGEMPKARLMLRYANVVSGMFSVLCYALIFAFALPLVGVFNSENDLRLLAIAVHGLRLYFISLLPVGYNTILSSYLSSTEKAAPAQLLSILRGLVLILPLAFIMARLWGMAGVWLAFPAAEIITAITGLVIDRRCT